MTQRRGSLNWFTAELARQKGEEMKSMIIFFLSLRESAASALSPPLTDSEKRERIKGFDLCFLFGGTLADSMFRLYSWLQVLSRGRTFQTWHIVYTDVQMVSVSRWIQVQVLLNYYKGEDWTEQVSCRNSFGKFDYIAMSDTDISYLSATHCNERVQMILYGNLCITIRRYSTKFEGRLVMWRLVTWQLSVVVFTAGAFLGLEETWA